MKGLLVLGALSVGIVRSWASAPIGTLYFTKWGPYPDIHLTSVGKLTGPDFLGIINNVQMTPTVHVNQGPIAVAGGDIRTYHNNMFGMTPGSRYDQNLNYLGQDYSPWQLQPGNSLYDGTSDGQSNYTIEFNGIIVQTDRDWQNPVKVNPQGITGFNFFSGITWDFTNDTLWIANQTAAFNVTKTGMVLSSFALPYGFVHSVAMDVDGTLWFSQSGNGGAVGLARYDRSGNQIGGAIVPAWTASNVGMEIQVTAVPEPATIACLGIGLAAIASRRRRKVSR